MAEAIRAVIFDMDGTITVPVLDFVRMKAEMGLPRDKGLLEGLSEMDEPARTAAEGILHRYERTAAEKSVLNDGVPDALRALAAMGLKLAILTRNRRASVDVVTEKHGLVFDAVVTREDSSPKPDPDGVNTVAAALAVEARTCVMVGDFETDIQAGRAAGAVTVHYCPDGRMFPTQGDFTISSMHELAPLICSLMAPGGTPGG